MKCIHFFVSGRVQGVSYRFYAAKKAKELELNGFVKNLDDNRVEVLVEGVDKQVDAFLNFCKNNPAYSEVYWVDVSEEKKINSSSLNSFEIL